jgi:hypothetical protein
LGDKAVLNLLSARLPAPLNVVAVFVGAGMSVFGAGNSRVNRVGHDLDPG